VITKDLNYRCNPRRAVYVNGDIDQSLIDRLTPRILELQADSRDPITVYIDSPGGNPVLGGVLLDLLRASNQDGDLPCRIITVVTATAASAAADLLAFGDYSIASQKSTILFHGTRLGRFANDLTVESTSILMRLLKGRNDSYAMQLARSSAGRLAFRYIIQRSFFEKFRTEHGIGLSDLDCFSGLLSKHLSPEGHKVFEQARAQNKRSESLLTLIEKSPLGQGKELSAEEQILAEADLLRSLIDFELESEKADSWTFKEVGLSQLTDDFYLLLETVSRRSDEHVAELCEVWFPYFLNNRDEFAAYEKLTPTERRNWILEKIGPQLQPLWILSVAICQTLQSGENELRATDAYWLGLIDEISGGDLPSLRLLMEYSADQEPADVAPSEPISAAAARETDSPYSEQQNEQ